MIDPKVKYVYFVDKPMPFKFLYGKMVNGKTGNKLIGINKQYIKDVIKLGKEQNMLFSVLLKYIKTIIHDYITYQMKFSTEERIVQYIKIVLMLIGLTLFTIYLTKI